MPIEIFHFEFISKISLKFILKNKAFSFLKTLVNFFLICFKLQRREINLIIKVAIEFNSFLIQNIVVMCCELQRHEINFIKVLFIHE